jgi:hypothetical protein
MHLMVSSLFQILEENIPNNAAIAEISHSQSVGLTFEYAKNKLTQALREQTGSLCSITSAVST